MATSIKFLSRKGTRASTPQALNAIRYSAALVIYAASTADIFINGVGQAVWTPIALAALAVLGVLAGVMLQVRGKTGGRLGCSPKFRSSCEIGAEPYRHFA